MDHFIELALKTPFAINVNNIVYIKQTSTGVKIVFTSGITEYFDISYADLLNLLNSGGGADYQQAVRDV